MNGMQQTAQFWDKIANDYAKKPIANESAYEKKLALTKACLRPSDVILDVGCGTGSLALELAPLVAEIHAIDISANMLKIAAEKATARRIRNVFFHQEAVERLPPLAPESVDGVCAYNILHLVQDRRTMLSQVHRLLKPGGFFVGSTVCLGESVLPYRFVLPPLKWLGKVPTVAIFDIDQHLAELDIAGFAIEKMHDVGANGTVAFVTARKLRSSASPAIYAFTPEGDAAPSAAR